MKVTTRKAFHEELEDLKKTVENMTQIVLEVVRASVRSLINQDTELALKTIEKGEEVDLLEFNIENKCMELLALYQPVAVDLRTIVTIVKIIVDLDRLADFSADVCQVTLFTHHLQKVREIDKIGIMYGKVDTIVRLALKAFIENDPELAKTLGGLDDEVDKLFVKVIEEGIETMKNDPSSIHFTANLILVSKYLERMADHACNIAGRTIYMVTGKRKKIH
ncbi:MAG: phosphate signaling complex protein PhoU [Candidatus Wukongarchaeota archaeon]|nr:phosphate signaling complex protein PhoU [Candidatus Wukongarchaeota archaeon]